MEPVDSTLPYPPQRGSVTSTCIAYSAARRETRRTSRASLTFLPIYMKAPSCLLRAALLGLLAVAAAPLIAPVSKLAAQARPSATRAAAPTADTARDARLARADRGRIRGDSRGVWIVVISDFQCPFCKKWHDETEPLIERDYVRTGKAQIAYINYPIPSIHANAMATHEFAMCAAEQGRFFPAADALFRTQNDWKGRRDILAYLDSLGRTVALDRARQERCIRSGEMRALIAADIDRSTSIGVGSTPSFLIGGKPVVGAQPYEAFKRAIDAAIAAAAAPKPAP
jgi:protein-disulfide isomerase